MYLVLPTFFVLFLAALSSFAQCPSISVIAPAGVTGAGDEIKFRVESDGVLPRGGYIWSVNKGIIIHGEGTNEITVATDKTLAAEYIIRASVQVEGLPSGCANLASAMAPVDFIGDWFPWDVWGILKANDERVRLDTFFAELANSPTDTGLIVLSIRPKERFDSKNPRLRFVLKHARYRSFPQRRIWFALEKGKEQRTAVWRIPPGGEMPTCNDCLIIKGGDL